MEQLQVVEYKDIRVLTTQQLAEAYETNPDTITKNFNRNKDRYVEGEHYICLRGGNLKEFRANGQIDLLPNIHTLYLWTEKGAFLHAKSLNTDKAWEVYDRLVDNYFRHREMAIDRTQLSPQMQLMNMLVENMSRQELEQKRQAALLDQQSTRLGELEATQKVVVDTFKKDSDKTFRVWANGCINTIVESSAFHRDSAKKDKYHMAWSESYERLNQKKGCRLQARVDHEKERAVRAGASREDVRAINKLSIIEKDKTLRPIYETVLKEMMLAYCVGA